MMDRIDSALIALLHANGREPTASLARKVGLSRSAVQERLARLERDGAILGYTLRQPSAGRRAGVAAHVFISADARHATSLDRALRLKGEVVRCHSVSGEWDMILMVEAPDAPGLDALLDQIGRLPGVRRTQSAVLLDVKFERG